MTLKFKVYDVNIMFPEKNILHINIIVQENIMFPEVNVYNISGIHRMGIVLVELSLRCKSYERFLFCFFLSENGTEPVGTEAKNRIRHSYCRNPLPGSLEA